MSTLHMALLSMIGIEWHSLFRPTRSPTNQEPNQPGAHPIASDLESTNLILYEPLIYPFINLSIYQTICLTIDSCVMCAYPCVCMDLTAFCLHVALDTDVRICSCIYTRMVFMFAFEIAMSCLWLHVHPYLSIYLPIYGGVYQNICNPNLNS